MKRVVVWGGVLALVLVAAWFATHQTTRISVPLDTEDTAEDTTKSLQPSHIALSNISEKEGSTPDTESAPVDTSAASSTAAETASNDAVAEEEAPDANAPAQVADEADPTTKLQDALATDASIQKVALIQSVSCEAGTCFVSAEPKPDQERTFQMTLLRFFTKHPEYGVNYKVDSDPSNAKLAIFTFSKTKLQ